MQLGKKELTPNKHLVQPFHFQLSTNHYHEGERASGGSTFFVACVFVCFFQEFNLLFTAFTGALLAYTTSFD